MYAMLSPALQGNGFSETTNRPTGSILEGILAGRGSSQPNQQQGGFAQQSLSTVNMNGLGQFLSCQPFLSEPPPNHRQTHNSVDNVAADVTTPQKEAFHEQCQNGQHSQNILKTALPPKELNLPLENRNSVPKINSSDKNVDVQINASENNTTVKMSQEKNAAVVQSVIDDSPDTMHHQQQQKDKDRHHSDERDNKVREHQVRTERRSHRRSRSSSTVSSVSSRSSSSRSESSCSDSDSHTADNKKKEVTTHEQLPDPVTRTLKSPTDETRLTVDSDMIKMFMDEAAEVPVGIKTKPKEKQKIAKEPKSVKKEQKSETTDTSITDVAVKKPPAKKAKTGINTSVQRAANSINAEIKRDGRKAVMEDDNVTVYQDMYSVVYKNFGGVYTSVHEKINEIVLEATENLSKTFEKKMNVFQNTLDRLINQKISRIRQAASETGKDVDTHCFVIITPKPETGMFHMVSAFDETDMTKKMNRCKNLDKLVLSFNPRKEFNVSQLKSIMKEQTLLKSKNDILFNGNLKDLHTHLTQIIADSSGHEVDKNDYRITYYSAQKTSTDSKKRPTAGGKKKANKKEEVRRSRSEEYTDVSDQEEGVEDERYERDRENRISEDEKERSHTPKKQKTERKRKRSYSDVEDEEKDDYERKSSKNKNKSKTRKD